MKQVNWNFYSCSLRKKYENSLDFVKATIDATTGADHLEIMDALQTYRDVFWQATFHLFRITFENSVAATNKRMILSHNWAYGIDAIPVLHDKNFSQLNVGIFHSS